MANVNFIRGNTTQINNTPKVDGQLLFDTQDRTMQMDNGTERIKIGVNSSIDISYDNTTSQLEADNVQEAIDEVVDTMGSSSAKLVDYDTWKTMPQSEKDSGQLWGIVEDTEYGLNNVADSVIYGDGTVKDALDKVAYWEKLWGGTATANTGIDFNKKGYKIFAIEFHDGTIGILHTIEDAQGTALNAFCGVPILLWTGSAHIMGNRYCYMDSYINRFYIKFVADYDYDGNVYEQNRSIIAIYGISK